MVFKKGNQYWKVNKNKLKFTCTICGKEFYIFPYEKNIRKYCSMKCFGEGSRKYPEPKYKVGDKIKKCKCGCGEWIVYKNSHKYKGIPNYIQGHSFYISWNKGLTKETSEGVRQGSEKKMGHKYNVGKYKVKCEDRFCKICEKKLSRSSALNKHKFCSPECYWESLRKYPKPKQKKILCACGCGKEINYISNYGRPRKFIQGHSNHGKKQSDKEIKKRIESRLKNHPKCKIKCKQCGEEYETSFANRNKIKFCSKKCFFGFYSGKNHPKWNNETLLEPYGIEFNDKFKRAIRKRDNQICMLCGAHREKLNRALSIHHIDYNKLMSIPQNCISLCAKCHQKTNYDREIWIKHFQSLLNKKYDYQYSPDREIILNFDKDSKQLI